jgi:glycosyltransferase involved in cell wall biosynthesis
MSLGTPIAAYPVSGPIDIVQDGLTGYMGDNLEDCINKSLKLNRDIVSMNGSYWTWENCWKIFKQNLIEK